MFIKKPENELKKGIVIIIIALAKSVDALLIQIPIHIFLPRKSEL